MLFLTVGSTSRAQGVLTVSPGRGIATSAGTGAAGFTGDGGDALAATLARPSGVVYDSAGNLFLADANNHVVREISVSGVITTVAGSGTAGFGGDGGPATSAFLDTPTSVAVDATGNLYIADSHNHRVREVTNGTITTVAGTGTAGFNGDGGSATQAKLALPSAVAADANGNLFIADTNNHRIRKLSAGVLTTVAGNGEELFAGDGGQATAASLDQPTGVAVDAAGNLYIADRNNQRVRVVNAAGLISTLAGNGNGQFSGSFGGDGASAASAALAKPVSVTVDAAGNILVADTNNQRIRQISSGGTIATIAGTGDQGFAGDSGAAAAAILNSPRAVAADSSGNLTIADTRNQRLRAAALGNLTFAAQPVGSISAPQPVTLANTGTAPITVATLTLTGPFAAANGGSCSATPVILNPGASCTENVSFDPTSAGQNSGSVNFAGTGLVSQSVLLSGTAGAASTSLLLVANKPAILSGEAVTLTATLATPNGSTSAASGSVTFYAGGQLLGLAPLNAPQTPSVEPGHTVAIPLSLLTTGATGLSGKLILAATDLPAGLAVSFTPGTTPLSNGQLPFTMSVTAPAAGSAQSTTEPILGGSGIALALLLFPFRRLRRSARARSVGRLLSLLVIACGSVAALGLLSGCGSNTGFLGQKQQAYNITISATATDATGGTLTRSTTVSIVVQ